jgi:hypothetical protein
MLRKIASIVIYFLLWLGCFQLKDIVIIHTNENIQKAFFCFFAGLVFAYMNGFDLFKPKINQDKNKTIEKK